MPCKYNPTSISTLLIPLYCRTHLTDCRENTAMFSSLLLLLSIVFNYSTWALSQDDILASRSCLNQYVKTKEFNQLYKSIFKKRNKNKVPLKKSVFFRALDSFMELKERRLADSSVLTVVDFDLPSNQERMFVIDMDKRKLLMQVLVSHGKNSGGLFAKKFSNKYNSLKSSLGGYITTEVYKGKHGTSLRVEGYSETNDNARPRAIVIHGAKYVRKTKGRLGRSHGCFAVSKKNIKKVVKNLKGKSVLYAHHSQLEKDWCYSSLHLYSPSEIINPLKALNIVQEEVINQEVE
jgi:hypothetical protein